MSGKDIDKSMADQSSASWLYDPRWRGIASQLAVVLLLAWGLYEIVVNTQANLTRLNQNFGYDFWNKSSGFDLSSSLISYSSSSSYGRAIIVGFLNTVLVAVVGIIFATILGFLIGIMRLSKNWLVSNVALAYVEIVRNIPLLLQLLVWYSLVLKPLPGVRDAISIFGSVFISNRGVVIPAPSFDSGAVVALVLLIAAIIGSFLLARWAKKRQENTGQTFPTVLVSIAAIVLAPIIGLAIMGWPIHFDIPERAGFNFRGGVTMVPEFVALVLGLSVYTASNIAEIVRSGIQSVSRGQSEASGALGLRHNQVLRLVIIPQAFRVIIPPLASQYLNLTKNSTLAIAIGFPDLLYTGGTTINQTGKSIEVVIIWIVVYLSLSLLTAAFMNWFNSRMKLVER
jgi:general L-amino acid transport system permease protein